MPESNLIQQFLKWEHDTPQLIFLRQPVQGEWRTWSFQQAGDEIRRIVSGLKKMNLPARSNIAILSKNCAHWLMADLAILMAGHVSVPLYANSSAASIKQILEHSESKAIFIGKLDEYESQLKGIPLFTKKIGIDYYGVQQEINWSKLITDNEPAWEIVQRPAEDLLTIMYTSGTTGIPKGVMFNSKALDHVAKTLLQHLDNFAKIPPHPQLFSYLPLCHIAERNLTELLSCYTGATVSFVETLDTFVRDLSSVQPHLFFGVPRIWAKFQEKILEKMPQQKLDRLLKIPLIRSLVKNKIKKSLGLSRANLKGTGAAPISVSLLTWFQTLDVTIREFYGMTENAAFSHTIQGKIKFGTVGPPVPTVDVKFSEEGEIAVRHPALMMGYFKAPDLTTEVMTPDGFLKTGDQGYHDAEGFLHLTGRIKDLFKTDKAKYVAPAPIEIKLLTNTDIDQACVVGIGIPQPIALIVLSQAGKAKSNNEITKGLSTLLRDVNLTLEHYEHLKKAVIVKDDWTIENGLITPTLKTKRSEIEKIYSSKYHEWYGTEGTILWEK